jgi:hypothetical protein
MKNSHRNATETPTLRVAVIGRKSLENDFATGLRRFATGLRHTLRFTGAPGSMIAANEAEEGAQVEVLETTFTEDPEVLPVAANEAGEQLIVPFVEQRVKAILPNEEKVETVQVFDATAANEIVSTHNSLLQRLKRTITGRLGFGTAEIPVYYRHPDANEEHADRREYGTLSNLRVGEDGLYGVIAYNEFGQQLLENVKNLRISPTWKLRALSDDLTRTAPRRLLSLGLTQFPNIPTAVAVNENTEHQKNMKDLLKALLAALSFSNERIEATVNGGADAVSITEGTNALGAVVTAANERDEAMTAANGYFDVQMAIMKFLGYTDEEIDAAREDSSAAPEVSDMITRLEEKLGASATAANENAELRKLVAANEVEAAISSGKIKPAEKDDHIQKLVDAEDFATACNELSDLEEQSAIKTQRRTSTKDLGARDSQELTAANEAQEKFNGLIADRKSKGLSHTDAYNSVAASAEGKQLLETIRAN